MMSQENNVENSDKESKWMRLGYMLLFILFYSLAEALVFAIMFVQFILALVTGTPNDRLKNFGGELSIYIKDIVGYVTYNHDQKVYPFEAWKKAD